MRTCQSGNEKWEAIKTARLIRQTDRGKSCFYMTFTLSLSLHPLPEEEGIVWRNDGKEDGGNLTNAVFERSVKACVIQP